MGIRFLCEHCRGRLNVKTSQAGELGLCIHCESTIRVPRQSKLTRQSGRTLASAAASELPSASTELPSVSPYEATAHAELAVTIPEDDQATTEGLVAGQHESVGEPGDDDSVFLQGQPESPGEVFELGRPSRPPSFGKVDPIEEAPDQIWYFRTREIGERGPLKAREMRRHVDQGHVGIGSMVWREDWHEWVKAETVFPELAEVARQRRRQQRLERAMDEAGYDYAEIAVARRKSRRMILAGLITLGLAIIVVLTLVIASLVGGA